MSDNDLLLAVAKAICKTNKCTFVGSVGTGVFKSTFHIRTAEGISKALKVYNSNNRSARVEREVEAMARCNHANIAKFELLSEFELEGTMYLYSREEFIGGGTLEERLTNGFLVRADAVSIGSQLVDAISHIFDNGLVHRDLKPANIMIRADDGRPVIVDFGLVRNLDASSLTETWIPQGPGTPLFAPPEQLNNEKDIIDWRADQFALGVVITMSMTGHHPYQNEDEQPIDIVERVMARGSLPPWFQTWALENDLMPLVRMVKAWPVQRYRLPSDLSVAWGALE